jgi:hypothetical protein
VNWQLFAPAPFIALLPAVQELFERFLDKAGLLGGKYIRQRLADDQRVVVQQHFVRAPNAAALLDAIETYFDFEESASDIIKFHLAFLISLYFESVEETRNLLQISGFPALGVGVVGVSLFVFMVRLLWKVDSPASVKPLRRWTWWTWVIFLAVLTFDIGRQLHLA